MTILYFAWVRSRIGTGSEAIALPDGVRDVAGLIEWLQRRGGGYADAFADPSQIRVAVNQEYVDSDHPLSDADEVAFFPPVTGG